MRTCLASGVLALSSLLPACTAQFNNHYDALMATCDISTETFQRAGENGVVRFLTPTGQKLSTDELKGLSVNVYDASGQARELPVSTAGCVALPQESGLLVAKQTSRSWAVLQQIRRSDSPFPFAVQLGVLGKPMVTSACMGKRVSAAQSVDLGLSLKGVETGEEVALDFILTPVAGRPSTVALKPLGMPWIQGRKGLDVSMLPEGSYKVSAILEDAFGHRLTWDEGQECRLAVDRTAPHISDELQLAPESLVTVRRGSVLPFRILDEGDPEPFFKVCRERVGSPFTSSARAPSPESCAREENFRIETALAFNEPGFWQVHVRAMDAAGNASPERVHTVRVESENPTLAARWDDEKLNGVTGVLVGRRRFHSATVSLSDDVTSATELADNLECRVHLREPATGLTIGGNGISCASGRCKGRRLVEFVPCGDGVDGEGRVHLTLDLSESWEKLNQKHLTLQLRTRDAKDSVAFEEIGFWIQDDVGWKWEEVTPPNDFLLRDKYDLSLGGESLWKLHASSMRQVTQEGEGRSVALPALTVPANWPFEARQWFGLGCRDELREGKSPWSAKSLGDGSAVLAFCSHLFRFDGSQVINLGPVLSNDGVTLGARILDAVQANDGKVVLLVDVVEPGFAAPRHPRGKVLAWKSEGSWRSKNVEELFGSVKWEPEFIADSPFPTLKSERGVAVLREGEWTYHRFPDSFPSADVWNLNPTLVLKTGEIWWAQKGSLFHFDGSWSRKTYESLTGEPLFEGAAARHFVQDGPESFFLAVRGHRSNGVLHFSGQAWTCPSCQTIGTFSVDAVMADNSGFVDAKIAPDGRVWVASHESLYRCGPAICDVAPLGDGFVAEDIWPEFRIRGDGTVEWMFERGNVQAYQLAYSQTPALDKTEEWAPPSEISPALWRMAYDSHSARFYGARFPGIFLWSHGQWVPHSTPRGEGCSRMERNEGQGWYTLSDGLSVARDGTPYVAWCGKVQKLTADGWVPVQGAPFGEEGAVLELPLMPGAGEILGLESFRVEEDGHFSLSVGEQRFEFHDGSWRLLSEN